MVDKRILERTEIYGLDHKKLGALVVKMVDYLAYEGYRIHKGYKNIKIAKFQQRKSTTQFEQKKLVTARKDIKRLNGFIKYSNKVITLKVLNVEMLRQSSTEIVGSKETFFGWY